MAQVASSPAFRTELTVAQKGTFILGAPAMVQARIKNVSGGRQVLPPEGIWFKNEKKCGIEDVVSGIAPPPGQEIGMSGPPSVLAEWQQSYEYDVAQRCLLKEKGKYELEYKVISTVYGELAELVHITIAIEEPSGVDKEAFDFRDACWQSPEAKQSRASNYCDTRLLEKYSTSIYAAWIYLEQFQWWKSTQEASSFLEMLQKPNYPGVKVLRGSDGEP